MKPESIPINLASMIECCQQSDQVRVCWIKLTINSVINMHIIPIYHTYIHALKVRHSGPFSLLSQVSSTVQSLQTPCQRAPQAWGQAAWRQGPEAPVHTALHSRAAHRLDHWAAGTRPWGWLLPWGNARGRMTQRQTGRDDAMSRISNSLTGTVSNKSLTQSWTGENTFRDLFEGLKLSAMWYRELGRSWTPVCTGSV